MAAQQAFLCQPSEETPYVSASKGGGSKARVAFNELLIAEVFKRREIWDVSSPDYRNSLVRSEHWKAIATVLGSKVQDVESRWRNLKDTYAKKLRDISKLERSGAAAPRKEVRWMYFEQLKFLKDTLQMRPTSSSISLDAQEDCTQGSAAEEDTPLVLQWNIIDETGSPSTPGDLVLSTTSAALSDPSHVVEEVPLEVLHVPLQASTASHPTPSQRLPRQPVQQGARPPKKKSRTDQQWTQVVRDIDQELESKPDEWDFFFKGLKMHTKAIPCHNVVDCQVHILQVMKAYSRGVVPKVLWDLQINSCGGRTVEPTLSED
ncbi:transcription factor Adf-1-like [Ixodes scapularis]